jgi:hypothetical protein
MNGVVTTVAEAPAPNPFTALTRNVVIVPFMRRGVEPAATVKVRPAFEAARVVNEPLVEQFALQISTLYPTMERPFPAGAVHDSTTFPELDATAVRPIGAAAYPYGVTAPVATAVPLPAAVTARKR